MRLSWAAIAGTSLGLALILPACGEDRTAAAGRAASPAGGQAKTATAASKSPTVARSACRADMHRFLGSMEVLRERLARGLSYDEYLHEAQGLRAAYREIEAEKLPVACLLAVGAPGERAFNFYVDAANDWGDCLATVSCDTASIEPKLQRSWALASTQLSAAQRGQRLQARD